MKTLLCSLAAAALLSATPAMAQVVVRVRTAPPAVRMEVRGVAPSPRHFWVNGYWNWDGRRHVWYGGRWIEGREGHSWVDARWENEGGQWVFQPGHWQQVGVQEVVEQPAQPIYVDTAPPPPQVEVIGVAPSPRHFWIGGHWRWEGGRHVWLPGRWELRREGYRWEHPRWEQRGRRWEYRQGGWRR